MLHKENIVKLAVKRAIGMTVACAFIAACGPTATWAADAAAGKAVYGAWCKSCHGVDGEGNPAIAQALKVEMKPLSSSSVDVKQVITNGQGKMKPIPSSRVVGADLANLVAYVESLRELHNSTARAPASTSRQPPSTSANVWMTTRDGKCQLYLPAEAARQHSVEWSGACVGGKASGIGTLRWYQKEDDELYYIEEIEPDMGISFVEGVIHADFDPSTIKYSIEGCTRESFPRVQIKVPTTLDLAFKEMYIPIMKEAEKFAAKVCPLDRRPRGATLYQMQFWFEGGDLDGQYMVCKNDEPTELSCLSTLYNPALKRQLSRSNRVLEPIRAARKKAQEGAAARELELKTEAFFKRVGSRQTVNLGVVCQNPFAYVGKIIIFPLSGTWTWNATSATSAFIDTFACPFNATGIPSAALTPAFSTKKVLAVKVVGKPQGVMLVQYVYHEQCLLAECKDFPGIGAAR